MKYLNKKYFFLLLGIIFCANFLFNHYSNKVDKKEVIYTEFKQDLDSNKIASLNIHNSYSRANEIVYNKVEDNNKTEKEKTYYTVLVPSFEYFWKNFNEQYSDKNIEVKMTPIPEDSVFITLLRSIIPILIIFALFMFMQKGAISFIGKNKTSLIEPKDIKETFSDVIGINEVKEEVMEIVDFLQKPEKFSKAGAKMPKGIILSGEPGTGKTMLAKALAKEAGVPFFYASGSSFVEMLVGLGASRVRKMFEEAKKVAPCIIFIDEIDAIGTKRGSRFATGSNDEKEGTLNELLTQMDGMESNNGIFVMGATNRLDTLDKALLRAGRFDRQLVVPLPSLEGRLELIQKLMKKYEMAHDFNANEASRSVSGLSGADITNLFNEAAIIQVRKNKNAIDRECFGEALDKIIMGMSNGHKLTEKDKRITAYHEAGHAVVGLFLEGCDPVHKVTITPRGRALGVTMSLPEEDRVHYSKKYLLAQISMLYGGFCAERIFTKDNTTGASNDIERATEIAKKMVTVWGLSNNPELQQYVYLSHDGFGGEHLNMLSEKTKEMIDKDITDILKNQRNTTNKILNEYNDVVEKMVDMLMEKEVISEKDIYYILKDCNIENIPEYLVKIMENEFKH